MGFDIAPYGEAIAAASKFGTKIGDIIDTVLKRVLPAEKMTEKERADLQQAVILETMRTDWSGIEKEFQDRADARLLAAKDGENGNAFTKILSATVRPVWGYASLVVVAYPYLAKPMGWPAVEIDDNTKQIVQTVIMFFFGGKVIEKVLPQVMGKGTK